MRLFLSPHLLSGNSAARRFHSSSKVKQHLGLPAHLLVMYGTLNTIFVNMVSSSYDPPLRDSPSQTALQLDILDAVPIAPDVTVAAVNVHSLVAIQDVPLRNPLPRPCRACARCLVSVVAWTFLVTMRLVSCTWLLCEYNLDRDILLTECPQIPLSALYPGFKVYHFIFQWIIYKSCSGQGGYCVF